METEIEIAIDDGFVIHGTLTQNPKKKSSHLIVFVHGLTGHRNEHFYFNGARVFSDKGYDVFRFDFYSDNEKARHFRDATVTLHGRDITSVLSHFKGTYSKIFLIGHSLGGPSILMSEHSLSSAIVLWDPSREPSRIFEECTYIPELKRYVIDWGIETLAGERMHEDAKTLPPIPKLMKDVKVPVKIIAAEFTYPTEKQEAYFMNPKKEDEFVILKGSGHTFDDWGVEEKLFEETLSFFNLYR